MSNMRGMRFQGIPTRSAQIYRSPNSEDVSDDDTDAGSESVRSVPSPADDLYDLDVGRGNFATEYAEYLDDDNVAQLEELRRRREAREEYRQETNRILRDAAEDVDASSESDQGGSASSRSPIPTPPSHISSRLLGLRDIGLDSELSDPPDFLEAEGETDDDSHEMESEGELSNMNSAEDDEEDIEDEEDFDEVPNPPCLPTVPEERLQAVWPLGDQSFSIFLCPITHDVMIDPVVSADGYTYERSAIARWFETSRKSPVTGQALPNTDLVPNHSVRTLLKTLIDMTDDGRMAGLSKLSSRAAEQSSPKLCAPMESRTTDVAGLQDASTHRSSATATVAASAAVSAAMAAAAAVAAAGSANATGRAAESRRNSHSQAARAEAPTSRVPSPTRDVSALRMSELRQEQVSSHSVLNSSSRAPTEFHFIGDAEAAGLDESSLSAGLARMQQRAQTASALTSSLSSSSVPSQRMLAGHTPLRNDRLAHQERPSSQPQPHVQHSPTAGAAASQTRPQSSTGCPQRPQAPSTTLPPLRLGQTPPRSGQTPPLPPDHGALRGGGSPPLTVPPLSSYHGGAGHGRLPSHPPSFPPPAAPLEGAGSQGSGNPDQRMSVHSLGGLDASAQRGSTHKRQHSVGMEHL